MLPDGSVSCWLGQLQGGDPEAARKLWERYFLRLVGLARKRLQGAARRAADEEDVALSAFDSFCRHAEAGRFPDLTDRESLWRLLMVLTARKAAHLRRNEGRQKRGGDVTTVAESEDDRLLDKALSREPSPDFAAQVAEEYQRLLLALRDRGLEALALGRMEGHSVHELAARLGIAPRTVTRKLELIRAIWEKEDSR
jgi:DNA-directed RNA polymerase specialized sigma24 family protein